MIYVLPPELLLTPNTLSKKQLKELIFIFYLDTHIEFIFRTL